MSKLPMATPTQSARLPPRGTALVVDDDAANRLLLDIMLRREGFKVVMASNGASAVEMFSSHQIDIVFMDVMMPVMDGYEATRLIKAHSGNEFVPVIFLTALNNADAIVAAAGSGGDDLLGKPFNHAVLNARIRAMERVRDLHRSIAQKHATLCVLHEKIVDDQNFARQIFQRVLAQYRHAPGSVDSFQRSAAAFCGDLFLSEKLSDGRIRVLVADFTGHGLAAAVGSIPVADTFRQANENGLDDFTLLCKLNSQLNSLLPSDVFMAACLVTMCQDGFYYWNGGMPSSFVKRSSYVDELRSEHLALGILPTLGPEDRPLKLDYQDASALIIYSDGLVEATDDQEKQLSEASVHKYLSSSELDAKIILASLEEMANTHIGSCELKDDITVAVINVDHYVNNFNEGQGKKFAKIVSIDICDSALANFEIKGLLLFLSRYNISVSNLITIEFITNELVNNAIDHGVLKLQSKHKLDKESFSAYYETRNSLLNNNRKGHVSVSYAISVCQKAHGQSMSLEIYVADSGDGFITADWLSSEMSVRLQNKNPWGRGIAMVSERCETLHYNITGNAVTAVYSWTQ